jgi:G3E family GTPase
MQNRTPLALITGSLGSGKTTLLKRIIRAYGNKLAVLINEFGEIGIDGRVIKGEHTRLIELAGGCVCCELTGEFVAAVNELLDKYQPNMIVLEATGVAEADALVYEVEDDLPRVRLDCVICIVDGWAGIRYPQVGYVSRGQLRQADIILINKSDLITSGQIDEVTEQVRSYNPTAAIVATIHCAGVESLLFTGHGGSVKPPAGATGQLHNRTHSTTHSTTLQSFTYSSDRDLKTAAFSEWADALPPEVFRAKGFVMLDAHGYLFNFVAGRWELEEFDTSSTQLVFIGRDLSPRQNEIVNKLKQCEHSDEIPLP